MNREEIIKKRIEELGKDIGKLDKKISLEAKNLIDSVSPRSLEKISDYKTQREILLRTQTELYAILGATVN